MPGRNGSGVKNRDDGPKIERRYFSVDELRTMRADGDEAEGRKIVGHAAVFNQETVINSWWGKFREKIAPGAFADTIRKDDIRALWNHNTDIVLGRNRSKPDPTLQLREDDTGLLTEIDPPSWADPQVESIDRGDVSGMSFAFQVLEQTLKKGEDGEDDLRTIQKVRLFEVSPVTFPAYPQTDVGMRDEDVDFRSWQEWRAAIGAPVESSVEGSPDGTSATGEPVLEEGREDEDGGVEFGPADHGVDILRRRQMLAELEA